MDTRVRCPRCGEVRATVGAFVWPSGVMYASRRTGCGRVRTGTGVTELLHLVRLVDGVRQRTGGVS